MSERLPSLVPGERRRKQAPSAEIVKAYKDNKKRLLVELARQPKDRWIRNNIRAYQHIIRWMEEHYDL